jgi:hypothetical protein
VTLEEARADLDLIQARVSRRASEEELNRSLFAASVIPLADAVTGTARRGLLLPLRAIAAVLLISVLCELCVQTSHFHRLFRSAVVQRG